jgi:two-component system, OmpR family, sensor kinase
VTGRGATGPRTPAAPARGARRLWSRTPLWARLVAGALALVAVGLTVTGVIGVMLFRDYLVNQSGQQLRVVGDAVAAAHWDKPLHPGLSCGALPNENATELIDDASGPVAASACPATIGNATVVPDLPSDAVLAAAAQSGEPFTIHNKSNTGLSWEVVVVRLVYRAPRLPSAAPDEGSTPPADPAPTAHSAADITPPADNGPAADTNPAAGPTFNGYVLVATSLTSVDATVAHLIDLDLAVDSAVGAALVLLGYAIVRTALRPLHHIETAAEAISAGDLSQRVPDGYPRTEIGRLSRALNGMLGQIETAFGARERSEAAARGSEQRMRRFIADASHELRTPLTSIRGIAELYRQGAVDPERLPDLIRRIEDEALRMGLLVEDLLVLARLDRQRPLARDPVHLAALAVEAIAGAGVRRPERAIELKVERTGDAPEPLVIGDETRLRQALDNLIDNALLHTPAEARVTVRVRPGEQACPGTYLVEVADTGPGLTREAAAHIFERFYRADPSRARTGDGGNGLGLAIVAAIADAHGGSVSVDTEYGRGALFRLTLPAFDLAGLAGLAGLTGSAESAGLAAPEQEPETPGRRASPGRGPGP